MRTAQPERTNRIGVVTTAAVLATTLEYFDFLIYSTAAALVFGDLFFPELGGASGTLASFATFAAGFLARPLGGVIAGHAGDRFGRKPPLVAAMLVMGIGTFAVGILPTYEQVGVLAPILLVVVRLIQGLGVGAQWGGAALLVTEHAPAGRRGFFGSLIQVGSILGAVLGNAVFLALTTVMPGGQFDSWGWRIPFWAGILLIGAGIYVQTRIEETPVFIAMQAAKKAAPRTAQVTAGPRRAPIRDAIRMHWRQILQAAGAASVTNVTFYILISGMLSYATTYAGLSESAALLCVLVAGSTEVITLPLFGALSDRIGRRRLYLTGAALMAVFAFPLFWLVNTGTLAVALAALIVAFTIHATMYGPQAALLTEMFPAEVRFSSASLGFQIASVLAGGFAPVIMTALLIATGSAWPISLYIIGIAAITFIAVATIKSTFVPTDTDRDPGETPVRTGTTQGAAHDF